MLLIKSVIETQPEHVANIIMNVFYVDLFLTKSVKEIMTGYDDNLLLAGSIFNSDKVKTHRFNMLDGVNVCSSSKSEFIFNFVYTH